MVDTHTNLEANPLDKSDIEISPKQREKQDALELAHLIYDIFMENQTNDNMINRGENV